jgi:hypothetical protein
LPATPAPAVAVVGAQTDNANVSPAATQPALPLEATSASPSDNVIAPTAILAEPTGGLLPGGATEAGNQSTPTPLAVAVIGAAADAPGAASNEPAAPAEAGADWPAYAGFAGLLLLLGALAVLVYRRRTAGVGQ